MPITLLKTDKDIYYIGEIFQCVATIHCDTIGGEVDALNTYISTDKIKWEIINSMQAVTLCGIDPFCLFGCTYDAQVAETSVASPGIVYIGCAIASLGYPSITDQFAANPGSVKRISILGTLPPGQGAVRIVTTPRGADVYVDGALWGEQTPTTVTTSVGSHQIRLSLPGYTDFTVGVNFLDGVTGEFDHIFTQCDLLCQITQTIEQNLLLIGVGTAVVIGAIVIASMTTPTQRKRALNKGVEVTKGAYNTGKQMIKERYGE